MRKTDNNRVLIIDDDPGVREAIAESLAAVTHGGEVIGKAAALFGETVRIADDPETGRPHHAVITAHNGTEGIALVKASLDRNEPFAMAFVDMKMPGLDGAQTTRQIWMLDPRIRIVIVTAFSEYSVEDIVRSVGRDDLIYLRKPFSSEEVRQLARALTRQWNMEQERRALAAALAQSREQEIAAAARIQETLLLEPTPDDLNGIQAATLTIASKQVDGDFFSFFRINSRCLDLVVGDVMGKGIPAALLGAAAKNCFLRTFNSLMLSQGCSAIPEPQELVAAVQRAMICQLETLESFITLCYARIDATGRLVKYVDCGHTRTIHYRWVDDRCDLIKGVNMPLGFPEAAPFEQADVPIEQGDLLFFYSDGLTEAVNSAGELFGEERLVRIIEKHARVSGCRQLIHTVKETVMAFSGRKTFCDDFTCVALKID